jgi:NDP-sugar pyrophosphorylase family protein
LQVRRKPATPGRVTKAFILGAGLGTRLRPLTERLPKPLVPLFHRPLAEWAILACARAGIERFAVNTHHLPAAWMEFGTAAADGNHTGANGERAVSRSWAGRELTLFHEPTLLETGGGLKNIAGWLAGGSVLVHNGDIFSTMPLARLIAAHEASGLPVTLALRSHGEARHLAVNETASRCIDIRGRLGRAAGTHVFSGVYCVNPELLDRLPAGEKISVIPAFVELAREDRLGVVVLDEGEWLDLGDRTAYLEAHRQLALGPALHPAAVIEAGAEVADSVVGPGAVVRAGAIVRKSVIWPGCEVAAGAVLDECVVFSETPARGVRRGEDL